MKKMNEYERHAYLYSAWTALFAPCILTALIVKDQFSQMINTVTCIGSTFIPIAVFYAAIGFYVREIFRNTSKLMFQFPIFKENETNMPTTEFLLWKNKLLSHEQIDRVHSIMLERYDYTMLDEEQEAADEQEARLNIVGAIGIMKKETRGDKILLQCNYRYGYQRNVLGGLVWSFGIILASFLCNCVFCLSYELYSLSALFFVIIQGALAFVFMKYAAKNYARTLINTFISRRG